MSTEKNNSSTSDDELHLDKEVAAAKEIRSRKDRPTHSIHFGDTDFEVDEEFGDATWGEVCHTCCVHSPQEWGMICIALLGVCMFLYFFLFGLDLLGSGAKVMSGCIAGELFGSDTNPIAGLMIGILSTVLLQSSSTTTSIIVSLVGDGSTVSVNQGIYMIMGANIGTSVTNTIVAMGQMGDGDQLERAFAGATVHDMFNFMTVLILLPLEVVTGYLAALTGAIVKKVPQKDGEKWEGPVKTVVAPLTKKVIIANKKVTKEIAQTEATCADFYPNNCAADVNPPTYKSCGGNFGLIACDKTHNFCPAFFSATATEQDDKVSGGVVFFLSIVILFVCLLGLVAILQKLLLGLSTRIVYKATDVNGYLAMLIGAGITVIVQSSSITTSTLTPLVGMGALRLEQMFPLTLGANIGTTVTGLMAALVADGLAALQVALAHLFFNITGIVIFYPVPFMRRIPLHAARQLGRATRLWRGFPIVYIAVMFFLIPIIFLGLSSLFEQKQKGYTWLGSFFVIIIGGCLLYTGFWCRYRDGKQKCIDCFGRRERRRLLMRDLPDDMDYLKKNMKRLIDHTGLPMDDEDEEYEETSEEAVEASATALAEDNGVVKKDDVQSESGGSEVDM